MSTILETREMSGAPVICSPVRKFTHEEYERMCNEGYFQSGERTELIHGEIRTMLAIGAAHVFATSELHYLLESQLPREKYGVVSQSTLRMETSSPDPDIYVTIGSKRNFAKKLATASDVCLIVEVADSSLAFDQGEKLALYAGASIPVYWIVNFVEKQIEVYSQPTGPGKSPPSYQHSEIFKLDRTVCVTLEDVSARVIVKELIIPG